MESNLAVLIDFENIAAGAEREGGGGRFDVNALLERVKDKGRVLVARSYADWGRFAKYKQSLLMANVTMMELTSHGVQNKNRADIAMVVDALELAFTKDYIDTYVVVSGDSDFTPMVLKMRELDKRVIGCGLRQSTSRLLIQACDEFIFYDTIVQSKRRAVRRRPEAPKGHDAAFSLLVETFEGLQRENVDQPLASIVKSAMLRKSPDFSEGDYGFSTFARFLEMAQSRGYVRIARDPKAGGYRVIDTREDEDVASEPAATPPQAAAQQQPERPRNSDATGSGGNAPAEWPDPDLPDGTEAIVTRLTRDGLNPLAAGTRLAVLEAFTAAVADREERNRKITLQFVQEDVRRALRRASLDVPSRAIRAVFRALQSSNALLHTDGTPIRSQSATFTLEHTAAQLNEALIGVYVEALRDTPHLDEVDLLASLLTDDTDTSAETVRAAIDSAAVDGAAVDGTPTDEPHAPRRTQPDLDDGDDLDALLTIG